MVVYWWEDSEVMDAQAICVFCREMECTCDAKQDEADARLQVEYDERRSEEKD